jgi:cell division protein FtsL
MNNLHIDPQAPSAKLYRTGFLSIILMVTGLLIYLWCHVQTMNQGQILEQLRVERQALLQDQERLQVRISGLKQSTRIRDIAMQKLGMVFPSDPPRNLYLKPATGATNVN